jgi:hypothetical protein
LTRVGVSVVGSRILRVRGRASGAWRETPINLLTIDDKHYLALQHEAWMSLPRHEGQPAG